MNNTKQVKTLSVFQFMELFPSEKDARFHMEKKIWGDTPYCPRCQSENIKARPKRKGYFCNKCQKPFTVKTNSVFEASNLKYRQWLYIIYLMQTSRKSISSLQLSKELGITQKAAWFANHRVREACNIKGANMLTGIIEMDETYIGGLEKNKHRSKRTKHNQGRSTKTKTAVVGMRSRDGVVKAKVMNKVNRKNLQAYIDANIVPGSTLATDEAKFYRPIKGYHKLIVNHSMCQYVDGMASTNGIESVWAVLKRGYHGTFHHFSRKHMDRYINEFTFRLNEGNCEIDTMDRINSLINNAPNKRLKYKDLIA